ncbi:sugar-binding transcriptional regulator [Actinomadura nitritigenes]|jgi:deoxyribonucleoside regulator|uniref:sugar-binding transcriptional regulator n=1 Tax=Actinomadura TaxID=1988 RepID=UPI0016860D38|nr:sugar-binding domain-containing protein [Actinomadura sp. RB99]MBD2896658.1 Deoxyribonucleoside regulator [Actinomadura sp. RB99]
MNPEDPDYETLLLRVAEMYYEGDQTQEQIGRKLHLTRWKVGRLLAEARTAGIVRIEIVHPRHRLHVRERELKERYGLRDAVVVPVDAAAGEVETRDRVAGAAARYLADLTPAPRSLGVSWGRTLDAVAAHIAPGWTRGVQIVQVNGGLSRSRRPTSASDMASRLAHHGGGTVTLLSAPAIVEQDSTRAALEGERSVGGVLDLARQCGAFLFSPGALSHDSVLVESGYLSSADIDALAASGGVGDVVGRFIDGAGRIVWDELDRRTIGITIDDLRAGAWSIAVVAGERKHRVCRAVVAGGICNVLVTDDVTAAHLLEEAA